MRTTDLPSLITLRMQFQRKRLAFGSIPVVGSSWESQMRLKNAIYSFIIQQCDGNKHTKKMTGAAPIREMAVESLRLFPPLYFPASRSAYWLRPSFCTPHCATYRTGMKKDCKLATVLMDQSQQNRHQRTRGDEGQLWCRQKVGTPQSLRSTNIYVLHLHESMWQ